jgi:hypothetical protein
MVTTPVPVFVPFPDVFPPPVVTTTAMVTATATATTTATASHTHRRSNDEWKRGVGAGGIIAIHRTDSGRPVGSAQQRDARRLRSVERVQSVIGEAVHEVA